MSRPRKDPRADLAARSLPGSGRRRFGIAASTTGPTGRPRRDPRAEQMIWRVEGTRLRLDRSQTTPGSGRAVVSEPAANVAERIVVIDDPAFLVAVIPDAVEGRLSPHDRQLFGAARLLAGAEGGVIALVEPLSEALGSLGADRLGVLPRIEGYDPTRRAHEIAQSAASLSIRHLIFPETSDGGDLARRVAARLGESVFAGAESISAQRLGRPARAKSVEQSASPSRIITVAADVIHPPAGVLHEARPLPLDLSADARSGILSSIDVPADPATVRLGEAEFVVAAGNGVTDFAGFRKLCAALNATPGASRVVCDSGAMPRESQVGASGTVLDARCYVAFGIAGAPQHLQGIGTCEHVVAINIDLHAAMIERAGLAIIADAQQVMPELIALIGRGA